MTTGSAVDTRNAVAVANDGLAAWAARRVAGWLEQMDPDAFEDCVQAARWGLLEAIEQWEPARGSLATCAWPWMRSRVLQALRDREMVRRPANLRSRVAVVPLPHGDDEGHTFDAIAEQADSDEHRREQIAEALALITPGRASAIKAHVMRGETYQQVADAGGTSRQAVEQRVRFGLQDLRQRAPGLRRLL